MVAVFPARHAGELAWSWFLNKYVLLHFSLWGVSLLHWAVYLPDLGQLSISEPQVSSAELRKNAPWQAYQRKVGMEPRSPPQQRSGGGGGGSKRAAEVREQPRITNGQQKWWRADKRWEREDQELWLKRNGCEDTGGGAHLLLGQRILTPTTCQEAVTL